MLISSELSSLGKALHSDSPNMETKGVASHRAPVSTLNAHRTGDEISHDAFVTALREEFAATYPGTMPVTVVEEKDVDLPKVWDDVADIKSWEWQYGQTPEFTNLITADLSFGRVTAHVHSRHALIQSLVLELYPLNSEASDAAQDALDRIGLALAGTRYESLEDAETILGDSVRADIAGEVLAWLRGAITPELYNTLILNLDNVRPVSVTTPTDL
ncbi:Biotin/lipoate A/B protein ligase [Apiotrichum porosum]|uniref:Biotin/lipoate A/B protein ligase n=1 Tax=Apiotrichum porosum TaxID=105984 RepID=A0A427Y691_9TREE|nr:Biotin/lipoate A/B protein ligase [Apiotrichum porosum]RSH86607.1 Biotin/lipoate A/B protein ligase [Apiotrichum porosum]